MPDPITLAALSAVALTEGVKFLYGQAGEVLKRRREREAAEAVALPDVFESPPGPLRIDRERADALEPELRELRQALSEFGQGIDEIDPGDQDVIRLVDALRRTLEAVFSQPIVFQGEHRPSAGVQVTGEATVETVRGYVAGIRARRLRSGQAAGRVRAATVEGQGQAVGLDAGTVG